MKLDKFKFFFPAQPVRVWEGSSLLEEMCHDADVIAEYKKNGWQWELVRHANGTFEAWNRHGEKSSLSIEPYMAELNRLPWKGLCCVQIEVLDRRTAIKEEKQKLFFFDTMIWDNELLVKKTFAERREILEYQFKDISTKYDWLKGNGEQLQLSKIFYNSETDFKELYKEAIKTKLDEGLVLKRLSAKLEIHPRSEFKSRYSCYKWKKLEGHMNGGRIK
jgi:hypothetical protein